MTNLSTAQQLALISRAWGRQEGYCFFPVISGKATNQEERIRSFSEGPAFMWPRDKDKIIERMERHEDDDLYWCPSLFEKNERKMEFAMDEHCLWADLDEIDPKTIDDYPPTMAWESSPGNYQALWILQPGSGDLQGASWEGGENQRLTYHLGADTGGWDTTQLLRIPGWKNHKPENRGGTRRGPNKKLSTPPRGRLLWKQKRLYLPDDFTDLPEAPRATQYEEVLEDQIETISRDDVWGRVRLKVSKKVRELVGAKGEPTGDRSETLWQIERELADAGCTVPEIVAVVRKTIWNKYDGRADEVRRLVTEASKAITERSPEKEKELEEEREEKPKPQRLWMLLSNVKAPTWVIEGIWSEGASGFIAGQPKSFKSWMAFDMALSVATGMDFLDKFRVVKPGPVLYIQEEDALPTLKVRRDKIWPSKMADRMVTEEGEDGVRRVVWLPPSEAVQEPKILALVREGFVISDPGWQAWLDEVLEEGFEGEPFRMVIMDPLMAIAGDVEENRSVEMNLKIFNPLRDLNKKHSVSFAIVHHMKKSGGDGRQPAGEFARGGQMMLGSVANHAWVECALYAKLNRRGVSIEVESKAAPGGHFEVRGLRNKGWTPAPTDIKGMFEDFEVDDDGSGKTSAGGQGSRRDAGKGRSRATRSTREPQVLVALRQLGGRATKAQLKEHLGDKVSDSGIYKQLGRLQDAGKAERRGGVWELSEVTE